jgi:hypothetical protein
MGISEIILVKDGTYQNRNKYAFDVDLFQTIVDKTVSVRHFQLSDKISNPTPTIQS